MRAIILLRSVLVPAIAAALISGCDNSTEPKDKPPAGITYPALSSPQNVLDALQLAYLYEDSTKTKAVYDSSYVGTSTDMSGGIGFPLTFSYADEVDHVATIARNPLVTVQYCTFGGAFTRQTSDDLSHPEWAVIQISGSNFQVDVLDQTTSAPSTYQVKGSNMTFTFRFKPSTPESSSPTDTLWKIIEWEEISI
jgi:hypothetical protein